MAARKTNSSKRTRKAPASRAKKAPARKKASPRARKVQPNGPYAFREILAITLIGACTMLLLALISYSPADLPSWVPFSSQSGQNGVVNNFIGPVGAVAAGYSYFFFGVASFLIPAVLAWWGFQVITGARPLHLRNFISSLCLVASAACLIEFQTWFFEDWSSRINLPRSSGGLIGYGIGHKIVENFMGSVGSVILMVIVYTISLIVVTGI
ncbi:MAG: DNA translocase FtsK 4TM domain-containing protein, partial [Verrucomicrobiales bacterium]